MIALLIELFTILSEEAVVAEAAGAAGAEMSKFLKVVDLFMKKKGNKLYNVIKNLTKAQENQLEKRFGKKILETAKKSIKNKIKNKTKKQNNSIPYTKVSSSWIKGISWIAKLNILTLKVKGGKSYKLPFFPGRVAKAMTVNKSPGKTLWDGYWRVIGKGSFSNKLKNKVRVSTAKSITSKINSLTPNISIIKTSKKGTMYKTKALTPTRVKTSNIPKTGAKGIKITIKKPKLR